MTGRPSLIVVGASYLQLPLVARARELGVETHVFAWEQGAVARDVADRFYPISIVERDEILAVARGIGPSGVISIASDLAMSTVNFVAGRLGLTGNSMACAEATTNKVSMRESLRDAGLPGPAFVRVGAGRAGDPVPLALPLIVKPVDRSGSRGVTLVDRAGDLEAAVRRALEASLAGEAIVEEVLPGREISVEMISWQGKHHYLTCTDKETTGPPWFVETGHHQPADLDAGLERRVADVVRAALDALGVEHGASHSELRISADGALGIVEIAARMGGDFIGSDLVRLSTGYDFLEGVIDVALGRFTPPVTRAAGHAGVRFLLPARAGLVREVVDHTADFDEVVRAEVQVRAGEEVAPVRESAGRRGYFMYRSDRGRFAQPADSVFRIVT